VSVEWLLFVALVALTGCCNSEDPSWTPLFQGIEYAHIIPCQDEPLQVHVLRVDLSHPEIVFLATPASGTPGIEAYSLRTGSFLTAHDLSVAVNASPFHPVVSLEGEPQDIVGLDISSGELVSEAESGYAALLITEDNHAITTNPPFELSGVHNAVGGFGLVVQDGVNVGGDGDRHPRTAVGITEDEQTMHLVVIDGRQPSHSIGATTAELGEWMIHLGSYDALNLDGGGSSTMVSKGSDGMAEVLNRPIHIIPGNQRPVANHLGIYAPELP